MLNVLTNHPISEEKQISRDDGNNVNNDLHNQLCVVRISLSLHFLQANSSTLTENMDQEEKEINHVVSFLG